MTATTTSSHTMHWLLGPVLAQDTDYEAAVGSLPDQPYGNCDAIPEPLSRTYGTRGVSYGPSESATLASAAVAHGFPSPPTHGSASGPARFAPQGRRYLPTGSQATRLPHNLLASTVGVHSTRRAIHSAPSLSLTRPAGGTVGISYAPMAGALSADTIGEDCNAYGFYATPATHNTPGLTGTAYTTPPRPAAGLQQTSSCVRDLPCGYSSSLLRPTHLSMMSGNTMGSPRGSVFQRQQLQPLQLPEPQNGLVAHPVWIRSVSLLGARSCKDWEHNTIGSKDQLEREFIYLNSNEKERFIGNK